MKVVENIVEGMRFTIATMVCSVRPLYFGYFKDLHCYGSVLGLGGLDPPPLSLVPPPAPLLSLPLSLLLPLGGLEVFGGLEGCDGGGN